jgi:hypothetical protein
MLGGFEAWIDGMNGGAKELALMSIPFQGNIEYCISNCLFKAARLSRGGEKGDVGGI